MARSLKKGPYIDQNILKKIEQIKSAGSKEIIKTWARDCTICPEMVGFTIAVYDGKKHIPVRIREEMVGHKLGEFAPTTRFSRHGGKIQRELEKKRTEKEEEKVKKADK